MFEYLPITNQNDKSATARATPLIVRVTASSTKVIIVFVLLVPEKFVVVWVISYSIISCMSDGV